MRDSRLEGYRKGRIRDWWDSGLKGYRKREIMTEVSGKEKFGTEGIQEKRNWD